MAGPVFRFHGVRELARDAYRAGVAAEDLTDLTGRLGEPIRLRARAQAPQPTGRMIDGIKVSKSRLAVMLRVGTATRLPYAAVNHWGRDGRSGPKWLSAAEETLRPQTFKGFEDGISALLRKTGW